MTEIWKKINGCPECYEVSDKGNVRMLEHKLYNKGCGSLQTIKARDLHPCPDHQGYMVVNIMRKTRYVHRLVAEAFIGEIGDKMTINHMNGNKADNSVGNLEIVTYSENHLHAFRVLHRKVRICPDVSKKVAQIKDGVTIATYPSAREAERKTGINHKRISISCHSKYKAGGYDWKLI